MSQALRTNRHWRGRRAGWWALMLSMFSAALMFPTAVPSSASAITGGVVTYGDPMISGPAGITVGPDGALWFTNVFNSSIGRITTDGTITHYTGTGINSPYRIVAGPDGALWFTERGAGEVGRGHSGTVGTGSDGPASVRCPGGEPRPNFWNVPVPGRREGRMDP